MRKAGDAAHARDAMKQNAGMCDVYTLFQGRIYQNIFYTKGDNPSSLLTQNDQRCARPGSLLSIHDPEGPCA